MRISCLSHRVLLFLLAVIQSMVAGLCRQQSVMAQTTSHDSLLKLTQRSVRDTHTVNVYNNLSRAYWYRSFDTAKRYGLTALALARDISFIKGEAEALKNIATVYSNLGKNDSAVLYYQQALVLYKQIGNRRGIAVVYNGLGLSHLAIGEYGQATEELFASLKMREEEGNINDVGTALLNVGMLMKQQGKYDEALSYYKRGLDAKEKSGEKVGISNAYNAIGEIHYLQKNYQRALEYHSNALRIRQELNNRHGIATSLNALGRIYLDQNKPTLAYNYFMGAMSIRIELHDGLGQIAVASNISRALQKQTKFTEALHYAERALAQADSLNALAHRHTALGRIAEVYEAMGKYSEAMRYFREMMAAKDSMYRDESIKRVAEVETRYQVEKKEQEIQILLEREANNRVQLLALAVGVGLLTLLIAVLVNRNRLKERTTEEIQQRRKELEERSLALEQSNALLLEKNLQLADLNDRLNQVSKDKDEFLSIATHDLKNPLSSILLTANVGERLAEELENQGNGDMLRQSFERIYTQSKYMLDIINTLLNLHRIETQGLSPNIEMLSANAMLEEAVSALQQSADAKYMKLHVQYMPRITFFQGDRILVSSVLYNLLSNAIKYTPKAKNIYCSITIEQVPETDSTDKHTQQVVFAIRDEGPGLTIEDQEKLFTKFAKMSSRPTGGENSTGLGLSIAKKMMDAMHGSIACKSEYGFGSEFSVRFPLAENGLSELLSIDEVSRLEPSTVLNSDATVHAKSE